MSQTQSNPTVVTKKPGFLRLFYGRTLLILLALLLQFGALFTILFPLVEKLPYFFGGVVVFTAVMLLYILNTRENPSVKLSWCIVVAVLPLFGASLYLFVRLELGHKVIRALMDRSVTESLAHVPDQTPLLQQIREEDKDLYNLAGYLQRHGGNTIFGNTQAEYFPLGEDKFEAMLREMKKAEKFIFLEYFSIAPSYMWDTILEVLVQKAAEGVEVRLMYDGSCAVVDLPYDYPKTLKKLGIRCKMFSPFRPLVSTHYNNRDHRKILIIDGHTAFTGGVNLLDRYINRKQVYGHWKDTAVMVTGDAARGFTLMFLQMWNADEKERIYEPYLLPPTPGNTTGGYVIPYGDSPLDRERVGQMVYLNILNQARDYVYIMTPYLILDSETMTALTFAAKRGVDVRLILPHIPDKKYAFALARNHYPELLEAGVKVYEYTPGFVHAKVFLSDDKKAVVGTINLDYRSLYLHFECAAYLHNLPVLADIREDFRQTLAASQEVTADSLRKRNIFGWLAGAVLKLVAPLM